jgi:hypothetical protein
MAAARRPPRLLGDSMRRKLEVTSAMAWEALVESHVEQAMLFIALLAEHEPIEESLPRYLREMDVDATMAAAVRTRVFTSVEEEPPVPPADLLDPRAVRLRGDAVDHDVDDAWNLLRQPQRVVRGVIRRQRRNEEIERITQLALARAEENVIHTHIENAIGFVALLEDQPIDRAVQTYLSSVAVSGGRAQTIFQRTMARLADVHLGPVPPRSPAR